MLCEWCGRQKADHTTHPAGVCECHRVRIPVEDGHMDITRTGAETPEPMEALQAVGRAVLAEIRSRPPLEPLRQDVDFATGRPLPRRPS